MIDLVKGYHDIWNTDKEILGEHLQEKDADADYLQGRNTYAWYAALSTYYEPTSIAEIGCRFGYSLKAMIHGVLPVKDAKSLIIQGIDNESYEPGCLNIVEKMLKDLKVGWFSLIDMDTQKTEELSLEHKVDMFHVDGDHSIQGTLGDLLAANENLTANGVILIDDIDTPVCPGVKAAVALFVKDFPEFKVDYYPTFRGLVVLHRD